MTSWYSKLNHYDVMSSENQKLRKRVLELETSLNKDHLTVSLRDNYLHATTVVYNVGKLDLQSPSRMALVTEARQVLYYLLSKDCAMSQSQIGRFLNRDHSTVCHGIETARLRFQHKIDEVRGLVK